MSGLSSLISLAARLEVEHDDMLTISIGDSAAADENHALEICGKYLCYRVAIRQSGIIVAASLMDAPAGEPDLLLRAPDSADGWKIAGQLVATLEKYAVKSLVRPIQAGNGESDDTFVIL